MCGTADRVCATPEISESLARAEILETEITELCAHINAASYRLLQLIAELDDEAPWGAWGLASCAHWLNWRCGIGLNAAREKVRVAHALKQLPLVSAMFATGELSFSKVRALTRIADTANEAKLLELARHATAAQVEKLVRAYRWAGRLAERERAATQYAARELNCYYDEDGSLVIRARLPADEGAVVLQALDAAMDAQYEEVRHAQSDEVTAVTSEDGNRFAQRRAEALTAIAESALRNGLVPLSAADRYQVVLHVTAETLADGDNDGRCELDDGQRLAPDSLRRIACDSSLLRITGDIAGNPLDIGRKSRAVPPAMRRALQARDCGCRFPGCGHCRVVDAHHIEHWANGGETSIGNLVLLCRRHHRLVHEGGFGVEKVAGGGIRFTRPDGRIIDDQPRLCGGTLEALQDGNRQTGEPSDAASWAVPADDLDYDIAVGGLLSLKPERQPPERATAD